MMGLVSLGLLMFGVTTTTACPTILLTSYERLDAGESITDGKIFLTQELNGNLRIHDGNECVVWETGVEGGRLGSVSAANYHTELQGDGNLVTTLDLQDTGRDFFETMWSSGISFPDQTEETFYLVLGCDARLAIFEATHLNVPLWTQQGKGACMPEPCPRQVLLKQDQLLLSYNQPIQGVDVFIQQEESGNIIIQRGTPKEPHEMVWQSCTKELDLPNNNMDFFLDGENDDDLGPYYVESRIQADAHFISRGMAINSTNTQLIWTRRGHDGLATPEELGPWELALVCEKLMISDERGELIAWETSFKPDCPVATCESAMVLLEPSSRIFDDEAIFVTDDSGTRSFSLVQTPEAILQVWDVTADCILWESGATEQESNGRSQAYTVMQADGNLVSYFKEDAGDATARATPVWNSGSGSPDPDDFTLVIENCLDETSFTLAIYNKDPTTQTAAPVWTQSLDACQG